ncbi:hypothetical protein [Roseateles koreensis]|uniref:Uncharacterized protein n=1 Tax=Roseateles koreensis TaxID=2987526 RepID=A0ABT5KLZ2_9BURK|nr:hypothetical protein [Roseateles koreensis]MDC8783929.1 hypothetical protein [Roseateles koreensis]
MMPSANHLADEERRARSFSNAEKYIVLDSTFIDESSYKRRLLACLNKSTKGKLERSLEKTICELNYYGAAAIAGEFTRRKIPPCFRGIQNIHQRYLDNPEARLILLRADIQWIRAMYPNHVPEWDRLTPLFARPELPEKLLLYLHHDGRRVAGQIAKALGLDAGQQRECAYVQTLDVQRWRHRLYRRLPLAKGKIEEGIRAADKRPPTAQDATIARRTDLWLCAELAGWKPQRTSELYARLTAEQLTRQAVAKQLPKLPRIRRSDGF